MPEFQKTLKRKISISGTGIHSGEFVTISLVPAAVDTGFVFRRVDLPGAPEIPADVDLNTDTIEHFTANTRDVTLKRPTVVIDYTSRVRRTIDNVNISQGFAYAGPRFGTINRFANTAFGINNSGSGITFQILNEIKVQGTRSSLDGRQGVFLMTSDAEGQKVKTNFALPTELAVSEPLFDNTLIKFDSDVFTMDNTNP